jgi:hypothetical protein
VHAPNFSLRYRLFYPLVGRVGTQVVVSGQHFASAARCSHHLLPFLQTHGQRFFAKHMATSSQGLQCLCVMQFVGRADVSGVGLASDKQGRQISAMLGNAELRGKLFGALGRARIHAHQLLPRHLLHRRQHTLCDITCPDKKPFHGLPHFCR